MIKGYGEKLNNLYQEIRSNNLKEHIKRLESVYNINPELRTLNNNIKS